MENDKYITYNFNSRNNFYIGGYLGESLDLHNETNTMDLKNLTPKDKELYKIAMERKETLFLSLSTSAFSETEVEEAKEIIHHISRAEYKRGKADGFALRGQHE